MTGLLAKTLAAVLSARRSIPILIVCVALVIAQQRFSSGPGAVLVAVLVCVAFVASAPYLWRRLVPATPRSTGEWLAGVALYGISGAATVGLVAGIFPRVVGIDGSFLSQGEVLLVSVALFWVGGWGLGRDIELEERLERERSRVVTLVREAQSAQLLAVRSHLDPHFLFNTLNAIAEWCREDAETAERSILRLSAMLRTMLDALEKPTWSLGRELELVQAVFELHQMRDPGAFDLIVRIDPALEIERVQVPAMLTLPLAENAMKHGPQAGHHGPVELHVSAQRDDVVIRIENPGEYLGPRPEGKGLPMVQRRLELTYDGAADLVLESAEGSAARTRTTLRLPSRTA